MGDMTKHGQRLLVAKGGWHGLGNTRFKSSVNRTPRQKTNGTPGDKRELLLELMLLIYRAIFVLLDIASAIQTAQNCRLGNRTFRSKLSCMGQMLSVLLVRSLKKSSLLYDAMESRLYDGKIQVLEETQPARPLAWAACCGWLILCTVLCILVP